MKGLVNIKVVCSSSVRKLLTFLEISKKNNNSVLVADPLTSYHGHQQKRFR